MSGLLIVNADDWGGHAAGTDAIATAFRAGAITSTTAMVHMADTARSAELAAETGIPLGLHLNLTQPFDAPGVPAAVRERQRACCARLWPIRRRHRFVPDLRPGSARLITDAIADQLDAFRAAYGREPTHLDSHHHVHATLAVLPQLPTAVPVRRTLGRLAGRLLPRRHVTTDAFLPVTDLLPELGGDALEATMRAAREQTVEVMTHPSFPDELPVLLGDRWLQAVASVPHGSFADLPAPVPTTAAASLCHVAAAMTIL